MLQQTQVKTVQPYFRRFIERFPTVDSLARASLDSVLKAWEGLGYYTRARNLHRAATTVVKDFGGKLPADVKELRKLPGIGTYTAGAIASIAFGADEPVLDGNVTRVLCRAFCVGQNPRLAATRKRLGRLAESLIPPGKAGAFNQALMDLGATVCTPRRPSCPRCPLKSLCLARARGLQAKLPKSPARKPLPHYEIAAGVVRRRGRVLIDQRHNDGLLGGLWEFPGGKVRPGETPPAAAVREIREEVGIEAKVTAPLTVVRHAYSHFRITMHVFLCRHVAGRARPLQCQAVRWVAPGELDEYAFPAANRKVVAALSRREGKA